MTAAAEHARLHTLAGWINSTPHRTARQKPQHDRCAPGLRFAFYGRTSTTGHQDPSSSAGWQREAAETTIADRGVIVIDYFDAGCSRRLPWTHRPQAAALLAAVQAEDRGFDAVVIGEYERAFSGDQFTRMATLFARHGVQVWLPEAQGPVNLNNPAHQALIMMLGAQSQREALRSRHRVLAAMRTQAAEQGRYLGGRPPYGYRLVDAGPHPNRAHAQWGRRLQRLEPDPSTAEHVRWIFTQRLQSTSIASIARTLNNQGVPCPSDVDRQRNPHRTGHRWTLRTVAAILANPRYTGRQVWNRQTTDHDLDSGSRGPVQRWNPAQHWVLSQKPTHPALVSEDDFVTAQNVRAGRPTGDGGTRRYLLAGLVRCGLCQRRMDAHWVNHRPGYRCRHGHTSTRTRTLDQPRNLYLREDRLLAQLTDHFARRADSAHPKDIADYLHTNRVVITYDGDTWALDTDP